MPSNCKKEGCLKQSSYGPEGGRPEYCAVHGKPLGLKNLNKLCAGGCGKIPSYGIVGSRDATHCATHGKLLGYENVTVPRCADCTTMATYGQEGTKKRTHCSTHGRLRGLVNVISPECAHAGCRVRPTYGDEGTSSVKYCSTHGKLLGLGDNTHARCVYAGCKTRPNFGLHGSKKATHCMTHQPPECVNIMALECLYDGCTTQPSYGTEGTKKALYCAEHGGSLSLVDVMNPRCSHGQCRAIASYGEVDTKKATSCAKHSLPHQVDVRHVKCAHAGCMSQPTWGAYCARCYATLHPDDPLVKATNKTEEKLSQFFIGSLRGDSVERNVRGARAPPWVGRYELDFLTASPGATNVECDGDQHFGRVEYFGNAESGVERDTMKTVLALSNGVSVVRVVQTDAWNDAFDWRALMRSMLSFAVDSARRDVPVVLFGARDGDDARYSGHAAALNGSSAERAYFAWMESADVMALRCLQTEERVYWRASSRFSLAADSTKTGKIWEERVAKQRKLK